MSCFFPCGLVDLFKYRTALLVSGRYRLQLSFTFLESTLQAAFQILQLCDLLLDRRQLLIQEFFDMRAGRHMVVPKDQKLTNLIQCESQLLGLADELQRFDVADSKQAEAAFSTWRSLQQSLFLVETDRVDAEPGLLGDLADLSRLSHFFSCSHTYCTIWSQLQSHVVNVIKNRM